jgi:ribA/ribD-fused uncharacterized protein
MEKVLFWSTAPTRLGRVLSNFWPCRVDDPVYGLAHPSAEHAYFYHLCADDEGRRLIAACPTARDAKAAAKKVAKNDYTGRHRPVMLDVLRWKFSNRELAADLLGTGDAELVHYAPWGDVYWGVGKDMKGQNLQGVLLMQVRAELAKGAAGGP